MNTKKPTCITEYAGDLHGKKVIVRAELNAPISDGMVDDDFRIKKFLPTLQYLEKQGAITIVLAHMGRELDETLEPVAEYLADHVHAMMFYQNFFHAWDTEEWEVNVRTLTDDLSVAQPGDIFLLDNTRQTKAEKANNLELGKQMAELGELYIHEAFPNAHREHMSMDALPKNFPVDLRFSGITFHMEHETLQKALEPAAPSVFILGGAKFETKLPLIQSFLPLYDLVIVGGALANNLFQLAGHNVGESLVEDLTDDQKDSLRNVLEHPKFFLPEIVTCETVSGETVEKHISEVSDTDKIYDISPSSFNDIRNKIVEAKSILWNGPLGYYEGGYDAGTKALANLVGDSDAFSIAGGGDTIDAIYDIHQESNFSFLSSAGGAMIDFLSDGDVHGVNVLTQ